MFGAHIAVPFFTPYMLRDLHLDYATYAGLTAIPIVVKALFFPLLHPLSERFGMRAVLACSGARGHGAAGAVGRVRQRRRAGVRAGAERLRLGAASSSPSYQLLLVSARSDCSVEFLSLASTMTSSAQLVGGLVRRLPARELGLPYHALFLLSSAAARSR